MDKGSDFRYIDKRIMFFSDVLKKSREGGDNG
jgi:hypothetical protein